MAEPDAAGESPRSGTPKAEDQLLRYAAELNQLREREREAWGEAAALRQQLARADAQQLKIITDLRHSYDAERERRRQLQEAYVSTIKALAMAVEARDDYTGGHIERVRKRSHLLGTRLGLAGDELAVLEMSAILHDLGKIGVPDAVLTKPDRLDEEEWRMMKRHPDIGAAIARTVPFLSPSAGILASHHERWDGTGYPRGLKGDAIPLAARIIAVADAYDALTTDRAYRRAGDIDAAVREIHRCRGSHFDPDIVDAFLQGSEAGGGLMTGEGSRDHVAQAPSPGRAAGGGCATWRPQ